MERGRLVISRRLGEGFAIGAEIEVHVLKAKGHAVKVVVLAPKDVAVRRLELEPKKAA
jgi:carbon storage regulator CsrA